MSKKMIGAVLTGFLAVFAMASMAKASVISGDWQDPGATHEADSSYYPLAPTDVAGVAPVDNWNVFTTNGAQTNLNDDSGTATTADFTTNILVGPAGGGVGSPFPSGTPDHSMMNAGVFDNGANDTVFQTYLTFSQVPYATFDLYIYTSANTTGRTATFRIGSDTELKGTGNPGTFVQGDNYVLFSGLTTSSFNVEARTNPDSTATNQVFFNGFQIVSTPEPASAAALMVGMASLGLRRRRAIRQVP